MEGDFYPEKISSKKMLPCYEERLSTVEINYTLFARLLTDALTARPPMTIARVDL